MRIIIDCMGSDKGPAELLSGVNDARNTLGEDFILVGQRSALEAAAAERGISLLPYSIIDTPTVITMEDDPLDVVRAKSDSSMATALRALRDGIGDVVVSCGNTGALYTGSTLTLRRVKGVRRAAIGTILPFDPPLLLLDSGANVTVRPEDLVRFAVMGTAYMRALYGLESPRVALLNNGTEVCKGTPLQTEAFALLSAAPGIRFVGNVEANALPFDACDIVVTDGFSGNIALKSFEGMSRMIMHGLRDVFNSSPVTKVAALTVTRPLSEFRRQFDAKEHGGSPILGLDKPVIKAHGSSDARAFRNAIRQAVRLVESGAVTGLGDAMSAAAAASAAPAAVPAAHPDISNERK